jgi:hypothetical protein
LQPAPRTTEGEIGAAGDDILELGELKLTTNSRIFPGAGKIQALAITLKSLVCLTELLIASLRRRNATTGPRDLRRRVHSSPRASGPTSPLERTGRA